MGGSRQKVGYRIWAGAADFGGLVTKVSLPGDGSQSAVGWNHAPFLRIDLAFLLLLGLGPSR
jgi:hypothetical protein